MKTETKKSSITCTFLMSSVFICLAPLSTGPALSWPPSYAFVAWHLVTSLSLLRSYFVGFSSWFYMNILLPFIYTYTELFNPFPHTFLWSGQKEACDEARNFITTFPLLPLHWQNLSFWVPWKNMQRWKNSGFQSSYAIIPNFTWKEMENEWQSTHSSSDKWKN